MIPMHGKSFFISIFIFAVTALLLLSSSSLAAAVVVATTAVANAQGAPIKLKIVSPKADQQVPVGKDLSIQGITTAKTSPSDCHVFVIVNGIKPYHLAIPAGIGVANNYSKWNFTLTPQYTAIKAGPNNKITAKYSCTNKITDPASHYSVNVTGITGAPIPIPTSTPLTTAALQKRTLTTHPHIPIVPNIPNDTTPNKNTSKQVIILTPKTNHTRVTAPILTPPAPSHNNNNNSNNTTQVRHNTPVAPPLPVIRSIITGGHHPPLHQQLIPPSPSLPSQPQNIQRIPKNVLPGNFSAINTNNSSITAANTTNSKTNSSKNVNSTFPSSTLGSPSALGSSSTSPTSDTGSSSHKHSTDTGTTSNIGSSASSSSAKKSSDLTELKTRIEKSINNKIRHSR